VGACRQSGVKFSISVKMYSGAKKSIATIPDSAWTPIPYFLEGAEVPETTYTLGPLDIDGSRETPRVFMSRNSMQR
jgi:hypothetical protein